jgi:hypothetical protein
MTVIPEKQETNEVLGPAYNLERVSRLQYRQGEARGAQHAL